MVNPEHVAFLAGILGDHRTPEGLADAFVQRFPSADAEMFEAALLAVHQRRLLDQPAMTRLRAMLIAHLGAGGDPITITRMVRAEFPGASEADVSAAIVATRRYLARQFEMVDFLACFRWIGLPEPVELVRRCLERFPSASFADIVSALAAAGRRFDALREQAERPRNPPS